MNGNGEYKVQIGNRVTGFENKRKLSAALRELGWTGTLPRLDNRPRSYTITVIENGLTVHGICLEVWKGERAQPSPAMQSLVATVDEWTKDDPRRESLPKEIRNLPGWMLAE